MEAYKIIDMLLEARKDMPQMYSAMLNPAITELVSMIRRRQCEGCGEFRIDCSCDRRAF